MRSTFFIISALYVIHAINSYSGHSFASRLRSPKISRNSLSALSMHDASQQNHRLSRRQSFDMIGAAVFVSFISTEPAFAKDATPESAKAAFDAVRQEVNDPAGGVAYMQKCINEENYSALLEFTKTYDQVLRKGTMGKAKKTLTEKTDKEKATEYSNAVTFDLIGINRSSRPGQESKTEAAKYLQELRDDVQKFLNLAPKE